MRQNTTALARGIYTASDADVFLRGIDALDTAFASAIRLHRTPRHSNTHGTTGGGGAPLFDQNDLFVIAYGDQFGDEQPNAAGGAALKYLHQFLRHDLEGSANGVHILPFYPYSSDDGFSVTDYQQVNPPLGSWDDIDAISNEYPLMVDLVCNHCSVQHEWFKGFLAGAPRYHDYFITESLATDLTAVFRPRTSPLLHPFPTPAGEQYVWTTFSQDQVDLNYASPRLLIDIINTLFTYIQHGARVIRLDAIAYLWKEIGTPCINHPRTHLVVQLMRTLVEERFPGVLLLTETNLPHRENISYFGDGDNEAHMVYNFTLPPLTLDAIIRGDATHLTRWAGTLRPPSNHCTWLNFLASHDGIGILPAHAYLGDNEMANLLDTVTARGGHVSYKQTPTGVTPYEMNVNYLSAATDPAWSTEKKATAFLTTQAIMCSLAGVPAPYIQSVVGSENWSAGPEQGRGNRSINRKKYGYQAMHAALATEGTLRHTVFSAYKRLMSVRTAHPAFHPNAPQEVIDLDRRLFVVRRGVEGGETVLCIHNTSAQTVRVRIPPHPAAAYTDILTDTAAPLVQGDIQVNPYQSLWLE